MKRISELESSKGIYQKLEVFIKKYYTNELIRGTVLFIGLGLLYFLVTLFVEYFLWLKPMARSFLFWIFVVVELVLLFRFIVFPLFKLFKLQKGINYTQAAIIIGSHFSEVNDTLTNFLQLSNSDKMDQSSELLLASIDQKAHALQLIPFGNAIKYQSNRKYLPFVFIPILFFLFLYLSGNKGMISQSLHRVVHFNKSFVPPAPFTFVLVNSKLETEQHKDFLLKFKTIGNVVPENVTIYIGGERYFMENSKAGDFQFKILKPTNNVVFHVEGNAISSAQYELKVAAVPTIANFEMHLTYPNYLKKISEVIKGTGNAVVPEGTKVSWKISSLATQNVQWIDETVRLAFQKDNNFFSFVKYVNHNTDYKIVTSNNLVKYREVLNYQLTVIKDQFPSISASYAPDSLKVDHSYVTGQIADDYGLSRLQVVYYPKHEPEGIKRSRIAIKASSFDQFLFVFPGKLSVEQGVLYEYYFEVFDNDVLHGYKSAKSSVFSNRLNTDEENRNELLQQQNDNIKSLTKTLTKQDKQLSEIDKLQRIGKEKKQFEFKDQQNVNDFIQQQKNQDEMMKSFAKRMNDNLDQLENGAKDEVRKELKERLDKAEEDLENNQKLLDELKDLNNKIKNEDLLNKLDQFKQKSKNQVKNLEQLVELTKKYYVGKKAEQLADKLDKLSEKQSKLTDNEKENSIEKQDKINFEFKSIQKELNDLDKENAELKSPVDLPDDALQEKAITDDLQKASYELQNKNKAKAKPNQKKAANKMKSMSNKMAASVEGSETQQIEEDVKMLRQILDNLLAFSLSQESVMVQFRALKTGSPSFSKNIKKQQDLKLQFKHVDDSLFTMSLRNPKIAEDITKEVGNVHYNIEKSLVSLSDAQIPKGISHQQYAVSSANKLGDFLSDLLINMQSSLSSRGAGKPKPGSSDGIQLPDIIKMQEGLGDKMKEGVERGNKSGNGKEENSGIDGRGSRRDNQNGEIGEGDAKALLEIYKGQQLLREALQKELNKHGLGGSGQNALDQMKQIEKQLLNNGFKNETLQKIFNLKQELLKLNTAMQQQGEESKRQSESNRREFNNESKALPGVLLDYLNSIEILNRQSLPLRSNFDRKVHEYFNKK